MYKKFNLISNELIERGEIKKCAVASLKEFEVIFPNDPMKEYVPEFLKQGYLVEALSLAPFASVKQHIHHDTWEIRINAKTREWDAVQVGGLHARLKNDTNEKQFYICIKGTAEMPKIENILKKN